MNKSILIKADNIDALKWLLKNKKLKGKIDLVYIDPPFATYNTFTIMDGRAATISRPAKGDIAYSDKLIGQDFIDFLQKRLRLIKLLMSGQGSIYLHTDYKVGHYVKVMMDEVFGINNFRNDITRIKCNPKNFERKGYGNIKDSILFYSKSEKPIWNEPYKAYTERDLIRLFPKIDKCGRRYTTVPIHAPGVTVNGESAQPFQGLSPPVGRHWRTDPATLAQWDREGLLEWSSTGNPRKIMFADQRKGKRVQDIWDFKDPQYPSYPTEKNADLLDLIIKTSSHRDSIVLDCFCGSGTSLKSAQLNGRKWIGIDASESAIQATKNKLKTIDGDLFIAEKEYTYFEF